MFRDLFAGSLAAGTFTVAQVSHQPSLSTEIITVIAAVTGLLVAFSTACKTAVWAYGKIKGGGGGPPPGGFEAVEEVPQVRSKPPAIVPAVVALLFVMLMVALSPGCAGAGSPAQRYAVATAAYTESLNVAAALRAASVIDDKTYWKVETARVVAASALDVLKRQSQSGGGFDPETLATTEAALVRLKNELAAITHAPSSRPTGLTRPGNRNGGQSGGVAGQASPGGPGAYGGGVGGVGSDAGGGGVAVGGSQTQAMNNRHFGNNARFDLPPGDAGIYTTMWAMRAVVDDAVESGGPAARLGVRIAAHAGKGEKPQAAGIYDFLRRSVSFKRDPFNLENLRHPDQLAEEIGEYDRTAADCDDVAMLAATLLRTCGIRPALVVVSITPDEKFRHVTAAAWLGGSLRVIDPQERMAGALPKATTRYAVLSW